MVFSSLFQYAIESVRKAQGKNPLSLANKLTKLDAFSEA